MTNYKITEKVESPKNDNLLGESKAVRIEQNGRSAWGFGSTLDKAEKDAFKNLQKILL